MTDGYVLAGMVGADAERCMQACRDILSCLDRIPLSPPSNHSNHQHSAEAHIVGVALAWHPPDGASPLLTLLMTWAEATAPRAVEGSRSLVKCQVKQSNRANVGRYSMVGLDRRVEIGPPSPTANPWSSHQTHRERARRQQEPGASRQISSFPPQRNGRRSPVSTVSVLADPDLAVELIKHSILCIMH